MLGHLVVLAAMVTLAGGCAEGMAPPQPTELVTFDSGLTYLFGSTTPCPDSQCAPGETIVAYPTMTVQLSAFAIEAHEVTNKQYQYCVETGNCVEPVAYNLIEISDYYNNEKYWDYPVVNVTWKMAKQYCEWAGRRLPTEAEWELVATGGGMTEADKKTYPWGEDPADCQTGSVSVNWCNQGVNPTQVMTSYTDMVQTANGDVFDMAGNVAEWVADVYEPDVTCKDDEQFDATCGACFDTCDEEHPDSTSTGHMECLLGCESCEYCEDAGDDCFVHCDLPICMVHTSVVVDPLVVGDVGATDRIYKGASYQDSGDMAKCYMQGTFRRRNIKQTATSGSMPNIGFRCAISL